MTRSTSGFPEIFQEMNFAGKKRSITMQSKYHLPATLMYVKSLTQTRLGPFGEILLEMIDALAVFIVFARMKRLLGRHLWQLKRFHQAVHSSDADVNAIITLKNMGDFICSKPFVIVGIDVKNLGSNHLIFFGSVSWC